MARSKKNTTESPRRLAADVRRSPKHIAKLAEFPWGLSVLNVAVQLKIPDLVARGVDDVESLAAATASHPPSLARLMRALRSLGVCSTAADGRLTLTADGRCLLESEPGSIRGQVLFAGDSLWKQFGDLLGVVRTGGRSSSSAFGIHGFDGLNEEPQACHAFHLSMAASSDGAARSAAKVHDFGRYTRILDVGGGYGGALVVLLNAFDKLRGAVFDLAFLGAPAAAYLKVAGVERRSSFVAGDFFDALPAGFDCYFLKSVLHDWDDDRALSILKNCTRAAAGGASVLLLEMVLPERIEPRPAHRILTRSDLTMLTIGGRERTADEYRQLLGGAGLALRRMTACSGSYRLIEAVADCAPPRRRRLAEGSAP
ncbi:MAG TPA: methyltransferase [Rhizomicrobium sp.]|nr:methyltransferase [Rhizomicrobium sp.]